MFGIICNWIVGIEIGLICSQMLWLKLGRDEPKQQKPDTEKDRQVEKLAGEIGRAGRARVIRDGDGEII